MSKVMTIATFWPKIPNDGKRTGYEPHGTIFQFGNIQICYLHTKGILKCMLKNISFGCMELPGANPTK